MNGVQGSLFEPHRLARREDPETSHAAARSAHGLRNRHDVLILKDLRSHPNSTCDSIASRIDLQPVQVSRRMAGLRDRGLVRTTGELGETSTGRKAQRWEVCA